MTKIESSAALKAFATIRFEGDALDDSVLNDLLRVHATLAYRKGETYSLGRRGMEKIGRTGCWFLNTKNFLETSDLSAHISFLIKMLTDSKTHAHRDHKFNCLKAAIDRDSLSVLVTLFWFGRSGSMPPSVSPRLMSLIGSLRGEIETDFTFEDTASGGTVSRAAS